jgi:hypothetical protein
MSLALGALVGLMANESRAETITLTITANGTPFVITNIPIPTGAPAALVNPPTSAQSLSINTGNLNAVLAGVSNYQFTELGVTSNWSGTSDAGAFLKIGGTLVLPAGLAPDAVPITISATEDGFALPIGNGGVLMTTANANYAGAAVGSNQTANTGSFNATNLSTSDLPFTAANPNPGAMATTGIGSVAAGFSLDTSVSLSLVAASAGSNAADTFAVTATVTATAIPEPASMVVMLTGMPLPLAVVGLLRRRRRAVA